MGNTAVDLFIYIHETLGICFWTPFALIVAVIIAVVACIHCRNQKKREENFQKKLKENQQDSAMAKG